MLRKRGRKPANESSPFFSSRGFAAVVRLVLCAVLAMGMFPYGALAVDRSRTLKLSPAALVPAGLQGSGIQTSTGKCAGTYGFADLKAKFRGGLSWASDSGLYIPGVERTVVGGALCEDMVPQGICVADDYILITAYCFKGDHDSVIYVMNKKSGSLKATISLSGFKNHVGGIAYDGKKFVWVATSGKTEGKELCELRIPLSDIESKNGAASIGGISSKFFALAGSNASRKASFNTYYKGCLWVGWYNDNPFLNFGRGTLTAYKASGNALKKVSEFSICMKANGATFFESDGRTFLLANSSNGRTANGVSTSYIYAIDDIAKSADLTSAVYAVNRLEMPKMIEGTCVDADKKLYMITESAAREYRTRSASAVPCSPNNLIFKGGCSALVAGSRSIANAMVTGISNRTYTGSAITQNLTVKPGSIVGMGKNNLVKGKDYTVSYANNVSAGTATMVVTGRGAFTGKRELSFKIKPASISNATVANVSNRAYTGKSITQSPKVTVGSRTLKAGTDYSISYKNNTKPGTATMVITGKGNYTGSVSKTFKIINGDVGSLYPADVWCAPYSFWNDDVSCYFSYPDTVSISRITSTNSKVLSVARMGANEVRLTPKGVGKSTVSMTCKIGGVAFTDSKNYTVKKFPNPIKSILVNGSAVPHTGNHKTGYSMSNYKKTTARVKVNPASGWKVSIMRFGTIDRNAKWGNNGRTIANGESVGIPKNANGVISIYMKNSAGENFVYTVWFCR